MIDKVVDKAADTVRDTLASTPWLPEYARPKAPSPPPTQVITLSTWERMHGWVGRHQVLSGVVVCVIGYVTYRIVRHSRLLRKSRRAKRARNGGRLEVVVIAGSPSLPLTKSLSLDLERRGFIVYIVCNTIEDEVLVQNLSRPDIKGLALDITDVSISCILFSTLPRKQTDILLSYSLQRQAPRSSVSPPTFKHHTLQSHARSPVI